MKTQKLKKAGLGTIVKSLRGAVKGAKQGYKTAKTLSKANPQGYSNRVFDNEFAKNVSESVKKSSEVQKADAAARFKKGKFGPDSKSAVGKTKLKAIGIGLGVLGAGMLSEATLGKKKKPTSKKTTAKKPTAVKKPAPIKKK
jgi:hypothetical protein